MKNIVQQNICFSFIVLKCIVKIANIDVEEKVKKKRLKYFSSSIN